MCLCLHLQEQREKLKGQKPCKKRPASNFNSDGDAAGGLSSSTSSDGAVGKAGSSSDGAVNGLKTRKGSKAGSSSDGAVGLKSPFSGKEGFGVQKTHFPSFWKREFSHKKSLFLYKGTHKKWGFLDRKLPFPAFVRARGNGGLWTPKPSFPGNGDSGPCLGSGESQNKG